MTNNEPQRALLWIRSAHEALEATTQLLSDIAPQWEMVMSTGYLIEPMPREPGYAESAKAAKEAWLRPAPGQLERDLEEEADDLAENPTAAEEAALHALPLPYSDHEALYKAHQAACDASARARRPHMQLSGEYLYLKAEQGPDRLIRNHNQATLQAMLRSYWQPLARGEASQYAIAPADNGSGGLAQWLHHVSALAGQQPLLRQYLRDRNTPAAQGLDIYCEDDLPDWDCPMGVLMVFATPALAEQHMQRLQHDARVRWWPDLASAEARWRQPDWPPDHRVQLCPFDLRKDKIWEGGQQVPLLP